MGRMGAVGSACAGASVLAALILLAAGAPLRGGLALELVGVVAATAVLALVAVVARTGDTEGVIVDRQDETRDTDSVAPIQQPFSRDSV